MVEELGFLTDPGERGEQGAHVFAFQGVPLTHALLSVGDVESAQQLVDDAMPIAEAWANPDVVQSWILLRGMVMARHERWEDAEQAFEGAVDIARTLSMPYEEAQALHEWGVMLQHAGRQEEAGAKLQEALEIFARLGARHDIERTQSELGAVEPARKG